MIDQIAIASAFGAACFIGLIGFSLILKAFLQSANREEWFNDD